MTATIIKAAPRFDVGQIVRHAITGEQGKVVQHLYSRYLVTWDRDGKTFIYPGIDLIAA